MGTTLEISPVTNSTAGQYRCEGANEATMTTTNYEYQVTVKCMSYFNTIIGANLALINNLLIFFLNKRLRYLLFSPWTQPFLKMVVLYLIVRRRLTRDQRFDGQSMALTPPSTSTEFENSSVGM